MNAVSCRTFVLIAGLLAAAVAVSAAPAAAKPGTASGKNAVNFDRTKARIEALLGPRLKPEPLPEVLPNPFQLAEVAAPVTPEKEVKHATERLAPTTDSEMLLYYGAMLRISGTVRSGDQTRLIINQASYKEGDIFTLKTKDTVAKLRIITIAPGELTLGLNDAVQVIKFKR
jgi:hypothetical protein